MYIVRRSHSGYYVYIRFMDNAAFHARDATRFTLDEAERIQENLKTKHHENWDVVELEKAIQDEKTMVAHKSLLRQYGNEVSE